MPRVIAFNAVFFLLPFAGYALWLMATRGSVRSAADWSIRTIAALAIGGAALMLAGILVFVHFSGAPPGSRYVPAHVEDGVLVPGRFD